MEPIRVLLEGPPGGPDVLGRALPAADDVAVVGIATDPLAVLLAAGRTRAEVVVLGMAGPRLPGVASHLLAEYPHLKVIGVAPDAGSALLYEMHPRLALLGDVSSPGALLAVIRAAVRTEVAE